MAKRNVFERALRGARDLLKDYIKPGAQTAEGKMDDLLTALGDARRELARRRRRFGVKRRTTGARTTGKLKIIKRKRRSPAVRKVRTVRRKTRR
jgi:hypothetical protein